MTDQDNIPAATVKDENEPNIIHIPAWNLDRLDEKIAKLNKKATKIGCPGFERVIIREYEKADTRLQDRILSENPDAIYMIDLLPSMKKSIKMMEIEIKAEGPIVIAGWKFIATFDHVTLPGSVIINTVPGEEVPADRRTPEPICEHCNTKRRRNETFLLEHVDTGEYKMVGRTCVQDFIGYDPKAAFQFLTWLAKLEEDFEDNEYWYEGGGTWYYNYDADEILRITASVIHKIGWVSRSKADFGVTATADEVLHTLNPPKSSETKAYAAWKKWVESLDLQNEKWRKDAEGARVWLREQDRERESEYMFNLHAIDQNTENLVPTKLFGYWCSLVSTYQRAMDRLREAEKQKKVNEHVGEVKERREFKVKLISVYAREGGFGMTYKHTFLDEAGHTIIWWASREQDFEPGEHYTIVGTIKKHDEWNNWKQTIITRVKEVT